MRFITKNFKIGRFFILMFLLIIYILVSAISYSQAICENIADNVFRLHVIANSDSTEDQNLKLLVRDEILKYMNCISKNISSKEELMNVAYENLSVLEEIAKETIVENGYDYDVSLEIGNFSFPTKNYGDITLPPGYYDALRIKIGKADGQNWWCVMFPPLCFVDVTTGVVPEDSKQTLKDNLSAEEFDLISSNSDSSTQFKFKIVEVLQNFNISGIFM